MTITTTDTPSISNEPITLAEAKAQLAVTHALDDDLITRLIYMAREEAEDYSLRTLRLSVTREQTYPTWPDCVRFDAPPLIAVSAVTYYDADNSEQTLDSSSYLLLTPTRGRGELQWSTAPGTTLPGVYDRPDAVKVAYTTGYQTQAAVPHQAKGGVLMFLSAQYGTIGQVEIKEVDAYRNAGRMLLSQLDWGSYE